VGGIRGAAELERRVREQGWSVGLFLYPTRVEQLMSVSNAGQLMPPKSTWFEPKLRSGLFLHAFQAERQLVRCSSELDSVSLQSVQMENTRSCL
jgi:hypothetical protein